ncbi:DUF4291 domain-containing protein [Streptosporangium sp. NBC_01639]|uniref:DUF4291 domain-containing protein n=1 Tax=Streptosporangium sp. NBC_01639 TaxID=2975948 RepID=UPI00386698DA|nr:DUF4291 domain-containing protein [Streptosporangium sp. NBC_01639]
MNVPYRQVRAVYTEESITVYQAYDPAIAGPAVAAQSFVPPFRRERMTWIKPSFLWMMYRCGWATKPGQRRVLAIEITRDGFEWALANSCLSHYDRERHADRDAWAERLRRSPVRIQWDPERDGRLNALPYRSLQIGLSGEAVDRYTDEWITAVTDVTDLAGAVRAGEHGALPAERPYPLPPDVAEIVGADPG